MTPCPFDIPLRTSSSLRPTRSLMGPSKGSNLLRASSAVCIHDSRKFPQSRALKELDPEEESTCMNDPLLPHTPRLPLLLPNRTARHHISFKSPLVFPPVSYPSLHIYPYPTQVFCLPSLSIHIFLPSPSLLPFLFLHLFPFQPSSPRLSFPFFQPSSPLSFDHFQVLRAIGKGSFGKVCIVQKRDSKQMFAMKYMNKTQCEARDALSNVFREIEILASLSHPFLVNLWFSFQDEEDMFMVVDLLLGGDLRYHVQQGVQYTDEAVRLYILEVAAALQYLHKRSIIHRDIKPDNLLLDEEGHVHLTDFNIATVLRDDQLATSMSGTKPYMAPEVFECAADTCDGYSFPVDWWSLGVTAYEVRRGKRPYDIHSNTSLHEIRLMFLQNLKFPVDCHPGLVHLISRLLTISPEKRISSIDEILALPYTSGVCVDTLLKKKYKPPFTPPVGSEKGGEGGGGRLL
ncbi:putative serine/threonine-protein kinase 32B [Penaeus vannamei]|uniref:Putative serine/threonine-protein kinase 32B n=1 Tax=Penaeus vannamei TaxID=6689 RepID=A0A423STF7_PENVA|nr:putative serine/threonine-protein kinase 32B [Penaeus vannamei]